MTMYLVLAGVLIVPLLPIFFLFRGLRSSAEVGGKLKEAGLLTDLQIKLGGAFAGYVVVVGGVLFYLEYQRSHPLEQVWQITGNLKFETPENFRNTISYKNIQVYADPSSYSLYEDGGFRVNAIVRQLNGKPQLPVITFIHPSYLPGVIRLDTMKNLDESGKEINVKQIFLHREN